MDIRIITTALFQMGLMSEGEAEATAPRLAARLATIERSGPGYVAYLARQISALFKDLQAEDDPSLHEEVLRLAALASR